MEKKKENKLLKKTGDNMFPLHPSCILENNILQSLLTDDRNNNRRRINRKEGHKTKTPRKEPKLKEEDESEEIARTVMK
jgi:hypothetical protein